MSGLTRPRLIDMCMCVCMDRSIHGHEQTFALKNTAGWLGAGLISPRWDREQLSPGRYIYKIDRCQVKRRPYRAFLCMDINSTH